MACQMPPFGWFCTRQAGHTGPCAAIRKYDWPLILVGGFFGIISVVILLSSLYFGVGGF